MDGIRDLLSQTLEAKAMEYEVPFTRLYTARVAS